ALAGVCPVVEPVGLGRPCVGSGGLEGLYGAPERIGDQIRLRIASCGLRIGSSGVESASRVGWGRGKFVAWVAANRARPGEAVIVRPGEEGRFLASQPLGVLPLDPDTYRPLRQLGIQT